MMPTKTLNLLNLTKGYGLQVLYCQKYEDILYSIFNDSQNLVNECSESWLNDTSVQGNITTKHK